MKPSAGHLILVREHHIDTLWLNSPRGTDGLEGSHSEGV